MYFHEFLLFADFSETENFNYSDSISNNGLVSLLECFKAKKGFTLPYFGTLRIRWSTLSCGKRPKKKKEKYIVRQTIKEGKWKFKNHSLKFFVVQEKTRTKVFMSSRDRKMTFGCMRKTAWYLTLLRTVGASETATLLSTHLTYESYNFVEFPINF